VSRNRWGLESHRQLPPPAKPDLEKREERDLREQKTVQGLGESPRISGDNRQRDGGARRRGTIETLEKSAVEMHRFENKTIWGEKWGSSPNEISNGADNQPPERKKVTQNQGAVRLRGDSSADESLSRW